MGFGQSKVQNPTIKRSPPLQMIDTSLFSNKGLNCPTFGNENMRNRFSEYNWSSEADCDAALNAQGYSMKPQGRFMRPEFRDQQIPRTDAFGRPLRGGRRKKTLRKNKKVRKTKSKKI